MFLLFLITWLGGITINKEKEECISSSLWKKNVEEGELCNDLAGCYLSRGSPINPPQKEQCRKVVRTVLRTGPGV